MIALRSRQQEDIYVLDTANDDRTAVLVNAYANEQGEVVVSIQTMGNGAPVVVWIDGEQVRA